MRYQQNFRRRDRRGSALPSTSREVRSRLDAARFELAADDPGMGPLSEDEDTKPIRLPIRGVTARPSTKLAPRDPVPLLPGEISDGIPIECWSSEEVTDVDAGERLATARTERLRTGGAA